MVSHSLVPSLLGMGGVPSLPEYLDILCERVNADVHQVIVAEHKAYSFLIVAVYFAFFKAGKLGNSVVDMRYKIAGLQAPAVRVM